MLNCHLLVIGGGHTGIHLVEQLSQKLVNGQRIVLVEENNLGGSFLNTFETPRHILGTEALEYSSSLRLFRDFSETHTVLKRHRKSLQQKIFSSIQKKRHILDKRLASLPNLTVVKGNATFSTKNLLEVVRENGVNELIGFEYCVIATGKSSLIDPEVEGLSNISFLYQDSGFLLPRIPTSLAIFRVTRENLEVAQIYANLGVKVDIYEPQAKDDIIKGLDTLGFEYLQKNLFSQQVAFHFQTTISRVSNLGNQINIIDSQNRNYKATDVYLHIEKGFDSNSLNLDGIDISSTFRGIATDEWGRTKVKNIWALGDCAQITTELNKFKTIDTFVSGYEAHIRTNTSKHIQDKHPRQPPTIKIRSNYPLFQIGLSEIEATKVYGPTITSYKTTTYRFDNSFVKVVFDSTSKVVHGVLVTGEFVCHLEEYLQIVLRNKLQIDDIRYTLSMLDFK
jgi:pyruvate/2-oxoglutarate dehydrogenase complex dihydrolipoamide dehydrogenase (E3) component